MRRNFDRWKQRQKNTGPPSRPVCGERIFLGDVHWQPAGIGRVRDHAARCQRRGVASPGELLLHGHDRDQGGQRGDFAVDGLLDAAARSREGVFEVPGPSVTSQ